MKPLPAGHGAADFGKRQGHDHFGACRQDMAKANLEKLSSAKKTSPGDHERERKTPLRVRAGPTDQSQHDFERQWRRTRAHLKSAPYAHQRPR